jgi:hypothetical protein
MAQEDRIKDGDTFIRAYHDFRNSVDFSVDGILPELDHLIWCMLIGVPEVPADSDDLADASLVAIDQRAAILKAVFVEVNRRQADDFLDRGLARYDQASQMAKEILQEGRFPA